MQDAYRHCEELVRAADKDRYLATLFAPADKRGALFALYAFNTGIVRVADVVREPMAGEIRLQWWRDVLDGERAGEAAANPVAAALLDTVARHSLSVDTLVHLIEAHEFDLYDDPMPTRAAQEGYLRQTSVAVVSLAAEILVGRQAFAVAAAVPGGLSDGLTAVLRSVARHASRRRLYVPLDLLEQHGANAEDMFAGKATPAVRAALAELRGRAVGYIETCEQGLTLAPPAAAPAYLPLALARRDLARMEHPDYDPFRTVVEGPQWRRQWTLWRAARRYSGLMSG